MRSLRAVACIGALALLAIPSALAADAPGDMRVEFDIPVDDATAPKWTGTVSPATLAKARREARRVRGRAAANATGDRLLWPALDDTQGAFYLKYYTLRAIGDHVEVWVASDDDGVSTGTDFPAGDCRNGERTRVTDAQVQSMVRAFDGNIYPIESRIFEEPPPRDGTASFAKEVLDLPSDYFHGDGDNIVVLVDNVRDGNFFDQPNNQTYIAGVFVSFFNEIADRNIMTIDAFDWLHRTGGDPPDEPVPGDLCASAPARPYAYESTFAHEYQHLLEYYADPDETAWVNEGLSVWTEAATGYVDPRIPIGQIGFEGALQCFLGWGGIETPANPNPRPGGAENSLTIWGDQGDGDEILCDYGAAESFMHFLESRYGEATLGALHKDAGNGLASVRTLVGRTGAPRRDVRELIHDWAASTALDSLLDSGFALRGGDYRLYRVDGLDTDVNWDSADAYSTPGAPPNGSDFIRLRGGDGGYLDSSRIRSISFDGAELLPTLPVEWSVDPSPPGHEGNPAIYSGSGANFDRAVIAEVTVPAADPTLTLETRYEMEDLFDYGFVQVSTDGGRTFTSLGNDLTVSDYDPTAVELVVENLPGLNGVSGGGDEAAWVSTSFDLSAYAGKTVLLSFRYVTDSGLDLPGWWIDDVAVGGTPISDGRSLVPFRSASELAPTAVRGFTVQLVGYTPGRVGHAFLHRLKLNSRFEGRIGGDSLRRLLGRGYEVVAAIVTYDEPTETVFQYAPYTLSIASDDVVQPGGQRRLVQRGG